MRVHEIPSVRSLEMIGSIVLFQTCDVSASYCERPVIRKVRPVYRSYSGRCVSRFFPVASEMYDWQASHYITSLFSWTQALCTWAGCHLGTFLFRQVASAKMYPGFGPAFLEDSYT